MTDVFPETQQPSPPAGSPIGDEIAPNVFTEYPTGQDPITPPSDETVQMTDHLMVTVASSIGIRPTEDRIVVLPDAPEEVSSGGIILAAQAQEQQTVGTAVAVGPGKRSTHDGSLIPLTVNHGDRVLYGKYAGSEVKHGGETYVILREEEIFAVIE